MTPDGPLGTYHHWDGYPTALGRTLWELYHDHFDRDLESMLQFLIEEHPAGWSSINNADFSKPVGYGGSGPACYCHGGRTEDCTLFPLARAAGMGCEYAYVFYPDERLMKVLSSWTDHGKMIGMFGFGDPEAEWRVIGVVALDGQEPDWQQIQGEEEE
jgi:hypothetical protein